MFHLARPPPVVIEAKEFVCSMLVLIMVCYGCIASLDQTYGSLSLLVTPNEVVMPLGSQVEVTSPFEYPYLI